jgi:hypothetical protein
MKVVPQYLLQRICKQFQSSSKLWRKWSFDHVCWNCFRKDGQDTTEDLRKRDLRDELEDRERHHFSSKERNYSDDRDRRKTSSASGGYLEGSKRDAEDRLPAKNLDADDSDAEAKSDSDER